MRIAIIGITGKVGKELVTALKSLSHTLVFGVATEKNTSLEETPPYFCPVVSLENADFSQVDAIIDFSSRDLLPLLLEKAAFCKRPLVIGTTGYSSEDFSLIGKCAEKIPLLYSSNFSLGILLLKNFISDYLDFFQEALIDIEETHDISKKDLPSGTSLFLADLFKGRRLCFKTPLKRNPEDLVLTSFRKNASFGSHKISLDFKGETLSFFHEAKSRKVYAIGALKAAEFLQNKPPRLYEFSDILTNQFEHAN